MKVLMLNGSPRAKGNTATALAEMEKIFIGEGIAVETVQVGNLAVRGCVSCYGCFEKGQCVFDDVVNELASKFREESRNKIVCEGITADCNMHQSFSNSEDKQSYVRYHCGGFYASCSVAQILNECHGRYTTMVCPYNAGVDCLDDTQCHRCGWNPVVAAERMRKWMEIHGCTT